MARLSRLFVCDSSFAVGVCRSSEFRGVRDVGRVRWFRRFVLRAGFGGFWRFIVFSFFSLLLEEVGGLYLRVIEFRLEFRVFGL